jgi:hypothetical protein
VVAASRAAVSSSKPVSAASRSANRSGIWSSTISKKNGSVTISEISSESISIAVCEPSPQVIVTVVGL